MSSTVPSMMWDAALFAHSRSARETARNRVLQYSIQHSRDRRAVGSPLPRTMWPSVPQRRDTVLAAMLLVQWTDVMASTVPKKVLAVVARHTVSMLLSAVLMLVLAVVVRGAVAAVGVRGDRIILTTFFVG